MTDKQAMVIDTDPQKEGQPPQEPVPLNEESREVAETARQFVKMAGELLKMKKKPTIFC